ncbi:MAG TPA: 4a-hydroxytetrahydrobiopterin dehydratase [Longimicrobiaceae bacterium]|jgi:4a-hydroxytetrahydrobiopterin dehydratase|nr:4a-hydroxytetrahydrobiopterin dehydratase [Longimicrobiaceae bacterium]
MTDRLATEKCVPCRGGEGALDAAQTAELMASVPGWTLGEKDGVPRIERVFRFPDFATALAFTNRVGAAAEKEGHHPALLTEWGRVTVTWWTHDVGGLHRNDFVMAAKADEAYASAPS